ncbi:hypothetical protein CP118TE_12740 [Clostridium perfringens E]|uniref:hypothetical protein n=1 Tax=Clostridium perfringens TaxID=1502 RepID=UPI00220756AF|nr:hypothetical protein [Clostridium perfringens]BDC01565.1 hypothetical protein CP118TE_12740 [Clostridium perfringens E]
MKVNLLDMYTPHELRIITCKELAKRKELKEKEVEAYFKEREINNKKKWNVKFGGYRW